MAVLADTEPGVAISPARDKSDEVSSFDPADFAAPTGREEQWRFTPLRRIRSFFTPFDVVDGADVTVSTVSDDLVGFDSAHGPVQPGQWLVPVDLPSALAWRGAAEITGVTVPPNTELADPITIAVVGHTTSYQSIRITVEHDSRAIVVIDHSGSGAHVTNVEVEVGRRACLTLVSLQNWSQQACHLGRIHTHVGADASFKQVVATFGGDVVRLVSTVDFDGPGGSAELLGAFFADTGQHLEHRLFVDHGVPGCRSNVVYKGALQGEHAHSVWIGDVLIRGEAVGTSTYEINRNLILTDGARADSVPNLEIETGDIVGAGHASATGRFDDEQLFYLRARGIEEDVARRLVVHGFFAEVLDAVPDDVTRARLWAILDAELAAGGGASGD
ncbi:MAG: Fe-S cluster assembly protein SufD [Actinomycetes bacterium]